MNPADNLADLYLLTLVVEAGGFSAAARQAGTTKSLLSRRIIALEKRLGTHLLHRNARHFTITAIGEQVYRQALIMREAAEAAEAVAREAQGMPGGHVRIRAHGLLFPLLEGMLEDFAQQHPHTRLAAALDDGGADALLKQQADIVLGMGESLPDSADIVARPLGTMRQQVVASPELLQRLGQPTHPDQIQDRYHLSYAGAPRHWNLRDIATRRPSPRFTSNHPSALLSAVRAGLGFAQLPAYLCHADLLDGRLHSVFESFEAAPTPLHALTLQGKAVSEATLGFVRFVRQHLATNRPPGILAVHHPE